MTSVTHGQGTDQRSLGELFSELAQQTGTLVRKEVELARVEMTDKAKSAGRDGAMMAAGGIVVLLGVMALVAALVFVLAMVMPLWASALLVGVVLSGIGLALIMSGIRAWKGLDKAPRRTIQTLQEDRRWLSEQTSR